MWTSMLAAGLLWAGCGEPAPAVAVAEQTLEVGCGTCIFQQAGGRGCYWAARIDGETYPMRGDALPGEAELPSHGPEGMCTMQRQAVVTGEVQGGFLQVEGFELLPPSADAPRAKPHDHEH